MARIARYALIFVLAAATSNGFADEIADRAWSNYALRCQGCHLADASGMDGKVPRMKDFLGYFLHSDAGRDFIVQVPGVAMSALPDDELSELMNWLLVKFSAEQVPVNFQRYTAEEVAGLRQHPENDPLSRRAVVLNELAKTVPALNCYSDAWVTVDNCS